MENFSSLSLSEPLARAINELGYEKPSPIQAQALPILLGEPTDFIGLAATGTGKTAAFSIPMLEKLDPSKKHVQALIMCPTRELVLQVAGQVNLLGKHLGLKALPIYGGAGYDEQIFGLKKGAQIVVGTPGRMIDHIDRKTLKLDGLKIAILDEADEMISMGFREDMETILSAAPRETSNIWLFSATMSPSVRKVANDFLMDPQSVQVNRGSEMLSSGIQQHYIFTQEKNKPEVLCKLIDAADEFYGVVFCQTKALVVDLTRYLSERGYKADNLHGDKTQAHREVTMQDFRSRRVQILICTDVAARGLDVKDVTHVINFSIPRELDNYVHRIGRTARSGKTGVAISLVTPSHKYLLGQIEKLTKSRITEIAIPTRKSLGLKKVNLALAKLEAQANFSRVLELMDESFKTALATMSTEEVAARFLMIMHPEIFAEQIPQQLTRTQSEGAPERSRNGDRRPSRSSYSARSDRSDRPARYGDSRPTRRDDSRPAARKAFKPAYKSGHAKKSDSEGGEKVYKPYRAPRSDRMKKLE